MSKTSSAIDYRKKIIKEIETLPEDVLPEVYKLIHLLGERKSAALEISQKAQKLADERKDWTRQQHIDRLLQIAAQIRQEAIEKGVAIEREEEAAVGD
jgi:hypothetical protein